MVCARNRRLPVVQCLLALSIILSAGGAMESQILHSTTQMLMINAVGCALLMVLNRAVVVVAISACFMTRRNMTPLQAFALVAVRLGLLLAEEPLQLSRL